MKAPIQVGPFKQKGTTHSSARGDVGRRPAWPRLCIAGVLLLSSWTITGNGITQAQQNRMAAATVADGSAIAFVQVAGAVPQTKQSTVVVTYTSAQGSGDTNIVAIGWNDTTSTINSVADSAGNSYQVAAPLARGNGLSQAIYYAKNIRSTSANDNTITVTFNQPAPFVDIRALEYSGLDVSAPFDSASSAAGSASVATSGATTTHAANELLFGAGMTFESFTGAGSGYTARIITSPDSDIAEDQLVAATGTYAATAPASGAWVMQLATFEAASSSSAASTSTATAVNPTATTTSAAATSTPVQPSATSTIDPPAPSATSTIDPPAPSATAIASANAGACGLSAPAFCDTFGEGPQTGGRSGDLDPSKWNVSRIVAAYQYQGSGSPGSFVEFPSVPVTPCRAGVNSVIPDQDSLICGASSSNSGQLMTATAAQNYGLLSYRPTQRFDFTNRTGKIVFDADATTGGGLDKWVSLFVTDQPLAGANNLSQVTGLLPRNGVGLNLDLNCGSAYKEVGVGEVFTYTNYAETNVYQGDVSKPCVATSFGALNHFEVDLSQQQIQVWGSSYSTDGGKTFPSAKLLASVPISLSFSVGYVHYQVGIRAPGKYLQGFALNAPYAVYHWKDLGFDGPVTVPDRLYQVPDALTVGPNGGRNLGYALVDGTSGKPQGMYNCCAETKIAPFTLSSVNLSGATSAQLTFDAYVAQSDSFNVNTFNLQYRLNGGPWRVLNPAPPYATLLDQPWSGVGAPQPENWWMALDTPVALSDLVAGTNTLELTSANASQGWPVIVANINLLVSTSTASAASTKTPVPPAATSTKTPVLPTATSTRTPVRPTATSTRTSGTPAATSTKTPVRPTATSTPAGSPTGNSSCKVPSGMSVAFCETFSKPAGIGNRSGQLNGTLWGVSHWTGNEGVGYALMGWPVNEQQNRCGTTVNVQPDNDVAICNGMAVETTDDGGTVTGLAMYPKQPFDFTGRTGTVIFDVSNNSQGGHMAWPEFWLTDKPVPAPLVHQFPAGGGQNSFGIRFSAVCGPDSGGNCGQSCSGSNPTSVFSVDSVVVVRNWQVFDTASGTGGNLTLNRLNCVTASTGVGNMNHMMLKVSQNEIDIYATDAGAPAPYQYKEIATVTNANLPLTHGLIWLEDAHYNGNKMGTQGTDTFSWGNVAFDGPVEPRDLAFDVNDNLTPGANLQNTNKGVNLGWQVPNDGTTLSLNVPNVSGIAQASAGLLTYSFYSVTLATISYSLNNGPWHATSWPYPDSNDYLLRSIAVPINLSEVRTGTNTIQFKASDGGALIGNIDLVMVGAGGVVPPTP